MERLLNLTAVLSVVILILVLASVRRSHIRVEYSVTWLLAASALLLLSRAHGFLEAAGAYLGVPGSPIALLLIAGAGFLLMFFRFSIIVSRLRDDNIALAQKVAILEYRIQALREESREERPA